MKISCEFFMFQVWQGSLLLCDYIMDKPDVFADRIVLELGGGYGSVKYNCWRHGKNCLLHRLVMKCFLLQVGHG